ncbi:MAG: type II toxin-antitoxin system RelE/ParE family toxin [Roseiarcus sp.]
MGEISRLRLRVTKRAASQIDRALAYVAAESPHGAARVSERIRAILDLLTERPFAGQATSKPPVRRISVWPFPYLIDYRADEAELVVLRFRHAARRPPT